MDQDRQFLRICEYSTRCVILVLATIILMVVTLSVLPFLTEPLQASQKQQNAPVQKAAEVPSMWAPPDSLAIPRTPEGELIGTDGNLLPILLFTLGPRVK